jgi:hypothetical protein
MKFCRTTFARSLRRTYDAVFEHPAALGLRRRDVLIMLDAAAGPSCGLDGHLTYRCNGETLSLPGGHHEGHAFDADELSAIRHFLQRAGSFAQGAIASGAHLMVVIDDRAARVYKLVLRGAVPHALEPYDPHGFEGHLRYAVDGDIDGGREPECRTFYEALAKTLRGADRILLVFGNSSGARGAINELFAEFRLYHGDLATRVLGTLAVAAANPTPASLFDAAREFYRRRQN